MNNAISRLIEAEAAAPEKHSGKPWWEEMTPERQAEYLREHPGSSKEQQKDSKGASDEEYDQAFEEHKHGVTEEEKKGQKTTDVAPYKEKPVVKHGEGKKSKDVKPSGPAQRLNDDDVSDVDFKETPRGKKEQPKVGGPKDNPKLDNKGPKWGAEDVDFKETPKGEKEKPKVEGPKESPKETPKSESPKSESKPKSKPAEKKDSQPDKEYKLNEKALDEYQKKSEKPAEESPKKSPVDSPKQPPKSKEAPKDKAPEKKNDSPKAPPTKSETPTKKPEKPAAVDRIKEDEDDEKSAKKREEERKEELHQQQKEKHDYQMEILRKKEKEREADRAEKKQ